MSMYTHGYFWGVWFEDNIDTTYGLESIFQYAKRGQKKKAVLVLNDSIYLEEYVKEWSRQ